MSHLSIDQTGVDVGTACEQKPKDRLGSVPCSKVDCSHLMPIRQRDVCAGSQEDPTSLLVAKVGSQMER